MYDIFISYRRVDTNDEAHALYRDLRDRFGEQSVFMDTSDSAIPWGAAWQARLEGSLWHCEALLALIGERWLTCTRDDGSRRLDCEDDWVRREVATALARNVLVIPVIFKGATSITADDLPQSMRELAGRQWNIDPIDSHNWAQQVHALITTLRTRESLNDLYNLTAAKQGVPILHELFATNVLARAAVDNARSEIGHTSEAISTLSAAKDVHDALHTIEVRCLLLLRPDSMRPDVMPDCFTLARARAVFDKECATVLEIANAYEESFPSLRSLIDCLNAAARLFEQVTHDGDQSAVARLLHSLDTTLPKFLDEFDKVIKALAAGVHIEHLSRVVSTVRAALPAVTLRTPAVRPLAEVSDSLASTSARLTRLVHEHGLLQSLDMTLSVACVNLPFTDSGALCDPAEAKIHWQRIETARSRLTPPFSPELQKSGIDGLSLIETMLRDAMAADDVKTFVRGLHTYATEVIAVFWIFDSKLRELCAELRDLGKHFGVLVEQGG